MSPPAAAEVAAGRVYPAYGAGGNSNGYPVRATLPGYLPEPPPGCGAYFPRYIHRKHSKPKVKASREHCLGRGCPDCAGHCPPEKCSVGLPHGHPGGKWAHSEAEIAFRKLAAYVEFRWGEHPERVGFPHEFDTETRDWPPEFVPVDRQIGRERRSYTQVVVSAPNPSRSWWAEHRDHRAIVRGVRKVAKKVVRKFARQVVAGAIVVHLWRGCDGRYDEWGPHAHVLANGGIQVGSRTTAAFHYRTGWVVKQVQVHNCRDLGHPRCPQFDLRFVLYRDRKLRRFLVYELGHAAILPGAHAISFFGELARFREDFPCATCGHDIDWHPQGGACTVPKGPRTSKCECVAFAEKKGSPKVVVCDDDGEPMEELGREWHLLPSGGGWLLYSDEGADTAQGEWVEVYDLDSGKYLAGLPTGPPAATAPASDGAPESELSPVHEPDDLFGGRETRGDRFRRRFGGEDA